MAHLPKAAGRLAAAVRRAVAGRAALLASVLELAARTVGALVALEVTAALAALLDAGLGGNHATKTKG